MSFLRRLTGRTKHPSPAIVPGRGFVYAIGPAGLKSVKSTGNPLLDAFYGIDTGDDLNLANNDAGWAKAYKASVWAFRCVKVRAQTLASIPVQVLDMRDEPQPAHPLAPVFDQGGQRLMYYTESDMAIYGRAFWTFGMLPDRRRAWVKRLNPQTMEVRADAEGVHGFEQRINGQKVGEWDAREMVFHHDYSPDNDVGGVSAVSVALRAVGVTTNISAYAEYFFANGAMPSGILVSETPLIDTDRERIETEWRRKFQGTENAHSTAILENGRITYQPITPPLKDLAMVELRENERREIAGALGVPTTIALMDDAANFATMKEQHLMFYTSTLLPELDLLLDAANTQLVPQYGVPEMRLEADRTTIEVLQEDRTEITARNQQAVGAGYMSFNQALDREGADPLAVDYHVIAGKLVPRDVLESGDVEQLREWGVVGAQDEGMGLFGVGYPTIGQPPAGLPQLPSGEPTNETAPENLESTEGLNGAQITAALQILSGVTDGSTASSVAIELLIALGINEERARRMVRDTDQNTRAVALPLVIDQGATRKVAEVPISSDVPPYMGATRDAILKDTVLRDLDKWQRKIANNQTPDVPFEPRYLPVGITAFLRSDLAAWDGETDREAWVKRAFDRAERLVKADDIDLATPEEFEAYWQGFEGLYHEIVAAVDAAWPLMVEGLARSIRGAGEDLEIDDFAAEFERDLIAALMSTEDTPGPLAAVFLAGAARGNDMLQGAKHVKQDRLAIDWQIVDRMAQEWAQEYTAGLVRGINETTLDIFRTKIAEWIEAGGTLEGLARYIEGDLQGLNIPDGWSPGKVQWATSRERARLIAQTETTRAFHEGAVTRWEQADVAQKRFRTQQDVHVDDDICRRLNNTVTGLRDEWVHPGPGKYQGRTFGIPAHPGCRCFAAPVV